MKSSNTTGLTLAETLMVSTCLIVIFAVLGDAVYLMDTPKQLALLNEVGMGWFMYTVVYNHKKLRSMSRGNPD